MQNILALILTLFCYDLFAEPQLPKSPVSGALTFKLGETVETMNFNDADGYSAIGIEFPGTILAERYQMTYANHRVLQVLLFNPKAENTIAQVGAITLVSRRPWTEAQGFPSALPNLQVALPPFLGLIMFESPKTPSNLANDEKLKGTMYAVAGRIEAKPAGKASQYSMDKEKKLLVFRRQPMVLQINSTLATPFQTVEAKLAGSVQFTTLIPGNEAAKQYVLRFYSGTTGVVPAEGGRPLTRDLTKSN